MVLFVRNVGGKEGGLFVWAPLLSAFQVKIYYHSPYDLPYSGINLIEVANSPLPLQLKDVITPQTEGSLHPSYRFKLDQPVWHTIRSNQLSQIATLAVHVPLVANEVNIPQGILDSRIHS